MDFKLPGATFEVDYRPHWEGDDPDYVTCVRVVQYEDHASMDLVDPDAVVAPFQEITLIFTYPLSTSARLTFKKEDGDGFTRLEFWRCVHDGYRSIYKQEDEDNGGDPGHIPGMLNRSRSSGRYGIWGHDIDDLFLEGVEHVSDGLYKLCMGS